MSSFKIEKLNKKATPIRLKEWHTNMNRANVTKKPQLFTLGNYEPTTI